MAGSAADWIEKVHINGDDITGCAVAQHCCNDDQQSQWQNGDFDPL